MQIQSIGIIGFGDFGAFLFSLAREYYPGIAVKVFSSRKEPDGEDFFPLAEVCTTDLLFICVPISAFETTVEKVLPLLGEHTIVCDVATVKKHTLSILKDKNVPRYIATHPMFGPFSYEKHGKSLTDLRIVVCESSLSHADHSVALQFLKHVGLHVLECTAEEHDRMVAETLFLTHLVGQIVKNGDFKRTSVDTVSFGFLMDAVESVAHDDALFRDVYAFNPFCRKVLERFEETEKEIIASLQTMTASDT